MISPLALKLKVPSTFIVLAAKVPVWSKSPLKFTSLKLLLPAKVEVVSPLTLLLKVVTLFGEVACKAEPAS